MVILGLIILAILFALLAQYLSIRVPQKMEYQWFDESIDFLKLESDKDQYLSCLSLPQERPSFITIPPWKKALPKFDIGYLFWYLLVAFGIVLGTFFYQFPQVIVFLAASIFIFITILIAVIDHRHHIIPDILMYALLWTGLVVNSFSMFAPVFESIWGAAIGYVAVWSISEGVSRLRGKFMMGQGDYKYVAALGAWIGFKGLLPLLLIASVLSLVQALFTALLKRETKQINAFGPCLSVSGLICLWFGGDTILRMLT